MFGADDDSADDDSDSEEGDDSEDDQSKAENVVADILAGTKRKRQKAEKQVRDEAVPESEYNVAAGIFRLSTSRFRLNCVKSTTFSECSLPMQGSPTKKTTLPQAQSN